MRNTYVIEGGIGKCVSFTALIDKLAEKDGEPIQVFTPYVDIIANNPNVRMGYDSTSVPLDHPDILSGDNLFYCEPYKSNFVFGKEHLIESYCKLFGIEYTDDMRPKLYAEKAQDLAQKFLDDAEIKGPYIMVQFTGGQSPVNWNQNAHYQSHMPLRNYPHFLAQQVVGMLKEQYPNTAIIDCTLPNEPPYQGTVKYQGPWLVLHELLKGSSGFIGIDSMLQHLSASAKKKGVVLWGMSRWTQFGYPENKNLSFHQRGTWDEEKFNGMDPRNIHVDPKIVVDAFSKLK